MILKSESTRDRLIISTISVDGFLNLGLGSRPTYKSGSIDLSVLTPNAPSRVSFSSK